MEKKIIETINENLEIVKNGDNFTEEQVENALRLVCVSCVKLFFYKMNGCIDEDFDFWKAIENKELEKCFKPLLTAKIKHTVRRCEKFAEMRKTEKFKSFYKEDLIAWIFDLAKESQLKINTLTQQT